MSYFSQPSFREAADQLGINQWTYITWEKQGRQPKIWQWPKVINFLGYDPHPHPKTFADRIATYRRKTGLTFAEVAKAIGVHECTVQSWEVTSRIIVEKNGVQQLLPRTIHVGVDQPTGQIAGTKGASIYGAFVLSMDSMARRGSDFLRFLGKRMVPALFLGRRLATHRTRDWS